MIIKGAQFLLCFPMYDSSTGLLKDSLTVSATISKDGAAFTSTTNSVEEISDGHYSLLITPNEMTADIVVVKASVAGALTLSAVVKTTELGAIPDAVWDELQISHQIEGSFGKRLDIDLSKMPG